MSCELTQAHLSVLKDLSPATYNRVVCGMPWLEAVLMDPDFRTIIEDLLLEPTLFRMLEQLNVVDVSSGLHDSGCVWLNEDAFDD